MDLIGYVVATLFGGVIGYLVGYLSGFKGGAPK